MLLLAAVKGHLSVFVEGACPCCAAPWPFRPPTSPCFTQPYGCGEEQSCTTLS